MQDAVGQKYYSVKSTQNRNTITIGNYIIDSDGLPQKYTPVSPVTDLSIQGGGGGGSTTPTVRVEAVVGGAPPTVTGTVAAVTGITNGSDTVSSTAFSGKRVRVIRGNFELPGIDPGDGTNFYTKTTGSANVVFSVALNNTEYIKIETIQE